MRVNGVNYDNNFKGSVDSSVTRYLNKVRQDALVNPTDFFKDSAGGEITAKSYDYVKTLIEGIMSKLNTFMSMTHSKTTISLSEFVKVKDIIFTNSKLDMFTYGGYRWLTGNESRYGTIDEEGRIYISHPELRGKFNEKPHSIMELISFDKYVTELTERFKPSEIDSAIFDSKAAKVIDDAKSTAPKLRFENRINFNLLDKLSAEFNRKPVYIEQFKKMQYLAIKKQEEIAKSK